MIIDLSNTGKFNSKINNIFSKVCYDNRENFNELIKVYTEKYHKDIFWWVSNPASRNTLNSELFSNYCKIQLILLLLKKGESIEILHVSSKEMLLTLNQIPSLQKTKIIMKGRSIKLFLKDKIFPLYIFIMELFKHCFQLIIFKIFFSNKQDYPKKPLTLIDTFVFPGYYSKDRYYNGLWELLNDEEKKEVYFFPTIIMTKWRNLFAAYKELIHSERKFLFKEKYLKISDIFFSTFYPIRILFFNINSIIVNKIDYSFLITDDLRKADSFNLSIEGLINYRFIKRLSCKNVKLNKVIDWWESQAVDKGLHKGLKDFYPEIRNVGYLGYAPRELELQLYPTRYEFHYGVVPNKISVIGEGFIKGAKLFHTNHEVDYSSAFRFRHLWNGIPHIPNKNYYTILIGLPITFNESIYIIDQIINCLDKIKIKSLRIWIKTHPTMAKNKIKNYVGDRWPTSFELIDSDTKELLRKCDILMSGMSSICLEAIALAIPVLVIENTQGIQYNPIPRQINQDLWRLCNSVKDIVEGIKFYKNRNKKILKFHKETAIEIRKKYFEPVSREGVMKLLGIKGEFDFG